MLTLLLLLLPLFLALVVSFTGPTASRQVAIVGSWIQFLLSIYLLFNFNSIEESLKDFSTPWVSGLGISFAVSMDGISLMMLMLCSFLVPLILHSVRHHELKNPSAYYALILAMQSALIGVFTATDGFLFYIFWELALIPIYFICLLWGGEGRTRITLKFFIYTLSGSLFMLAGLVYLYLQTPAPHSFSIEAFYQLSLGPEAQNWIFWCFFLAFAIKIPVFPFHSWQPDTYTIAPVQGTMLLSGIMLKMGLYGILRWMVPVVPDAMEEWGTTAAVLSGIGIVYASLIALRQNDFKRLLAYSSMAHVGLISAGIFSMTPQGFQGAVFQMLSHGVNAVALFYIADILENRMGTRMRSELGGIASDKNRYFTVLFMVIMLGSIALPLTNGFVGEFLLLSGLYAFKPWLAAFGGLTVILGATYMLRSYQDIMLGEREYNSRTFTELSGNEKVVLTALAALVVLMGVYPGPLIDLSQPALEELLSYVKDIY